MKSNTYITEACIAQRMYALGYKRKAIAEVLNCSMTKVDKLIPNHDRQGVYKLPIIRHLCELRFEKFCTLEDISTVHGIPLSSVYVLCKTHQDHYTKYSTYHCEACNELNKGR